VGFGDYTQVFGGLYSMGSGLETTLLDSSSIRSSVLNLRDLASPNAPDFDILGPGSQVCELGYSMRVLSALAPVDTLGLELDFEGSFNAAAPFIFRAIQTIALPIYQAGLEYEFSGKSRSEHPAVDFFLGNLTGRTLTVSFQFWGKAL
jgi:hypothetical protein